MLLSCVAASGSVSQPQGMGVGCRGMSLEALGCLSGHGSVASALGSVFLSPCYFPCVVQAKHRGQNPCPCLPACPFLPLSRFLEKSSRVLVLPSGLCCHAGRGGGGSHPDISFQGVGGPSPSSGRWEVGAWLGSRSRLLQALISAENHLRLCVPGASSEPSSRLP